MSKPRPLRAASPQTQPTRSSAPGAKITVGNSGGHSPSSPLPASPSAGAPASGRSPEVERSEKKGVNPWIKALVFFHLLAIFVWSTPNPPDPYLKGEPWKLKTDSLSNFAQSLNDGYRIWSLNNLKQSPIKFYDVTTGFWQYWDMFAPNPADTDFYGEATITYKNGSTSIYSYPRMFKLDLVSKYMKERYRKFFERANADAYSYLWPRFAQYVALLNYKDRANPPVKVALRRYWKTVSPPGQPQPTSYTSYTYYRFDVDQDELQYEASSPWVTPYQPKQNSFLSSTDPSSSADSSSGVSNQ